MAVGSRQAVSVGATSAVRLDEFDKRGAERVIVIAQGTGTLCFGGNHMVTSATGARIPVVAGTTIAVDLDQQEELWGISSSGSVSVDVLLAGV